MAIDFAVEIGILTDIERAFRPQQHRYHVSLDILRGLQILRIVPARVGLTVLSQILAVKRHDLFEVCLGPRPAFGILIDAAPHRIDQCDRSVERLPRALGRLLIARLRAQHRVIHAVRIDVLLVFAPATELLFVRSIITGDKFVTLFLGQEFLCRWRAAKSLTNRWSRAWIVNHGLQDRGHALRLDIATELGDLIAIGPEDDGRRPAPIAIAAGEVGVGVLIGTNRNVFGSQKFVDLLVRVGGFFHHVAPVAPHGFEIEDHEAFLCRRLSEDVLMPFAPLGVTIGGQRGCDEQRSHRDGQNADKFHW